MGKINGHASRRKGRVVVWGLLGSQPFGGMTWQVWHYLEALRRLGFDTWYVEDTDRTVLDCEEFCPTLDFLPNVEFVSRQMEAIGLGDRWVYRPPRVTTACFGARDILGLKSLYREADAVFNLCGAQEPRPEHDVARCRVYVQTDPAGDQVKISSGNPDKIAELDAYQHHFTYGMNLHAADCQIPVERYDWKITRPPVVTDWWRTDDGHAPRPMLTTVMNWKRNSKRNVRWKKETWRFSKQEELLRFVDLPSRSPLPLEMAVCAISGEDEARLKSKGWMLRPGTSLACPQAYRDYIRGSLAEFTVAKDQYVSTRSGWFSDRGVCYLAAGRPSITQDTRIAPYLPTGEGILVYSSMEEAAEAIRAVEGDYARHARRAREIAASQFEATRVVREMLEAIGLL